MQWARRSPRAQKHHPKWKYCWILPQLFLLGTTAAPVEAQQVMVPADYRADPLAWFFNAKFADAIRLGETALADPSVSPQEQDRVLVAIATVRVSQKREPDARTAFLRMLKDDPAKDLDEPARLPPPVTTLFYHLRDSLCLARFDELVAEKKLGSDIRTIAVGDIENNSIVKTQYDMDGFSRGLVHIITGDLAATSSLKIVDRQRLTVLMDELKLARDPALMAPKDRVRLGNLTSAQSYLFGQIMQLDKKRIRLDLRWVDTATGEILLARAVEGSFRSADDLLKLEKTLLVDKLAPEIERVLNAKGESTQLRKELEKALQQKRSSKGRSSYVQAVEAAGRAVSQEASGDYGMAASSWELVSQLFPEDATAALRAKTLRAFQKAGSD